MEDLYHGSAIQFDEFELQRVPSSGRDMGFGIYLTDKQERAERYTESDGYIYKVALDEKAENSMPLSADKVTLTTDKLEAIITKIAENQIADEGYPYMLSDWDEPTSETEIDAGNKRIIKTIAESLIDDSDDLQIINGINNQLGGNDSGASVLVPVLNDLNIHYAVQDFEFQNEMTKEYVIFNAKDINIVERTQAISEPELNNEQPNHDIKIDRYATGKIQNQEISPSHIDYFSETALEEFDLTSASTDELKALTYNLLTQSKTTADQIATMSDDDNSLVYWESDYENEEESYQELADELSNRNIDMPKKLDYFDNRAAFEEIRIGIKAQFEQNAELKQETQHVKQEVPEQTKTNPDVSKNIQCELKAFANSNPEVQKESKQQVQQTITH